MSLAQLPHKEYFRTIRFQAKPIIETLTLEYKQPKAVNRQRLEMECVWNSNDPTLVKIKCSYFNIDDFLLVAKTDGYWGKYRAYCGENFEMAENWEISVEDFERLVNWLTNIHEKKYYYNL